MNEKPLKLRALPPVETRAGMAPMAKVRRVALIEREVRERLGEAAVDLLLGRAHVLAEGQRSPTGRARFYGTVMLTIDVAKVASELRGAEDAVVAARRVAELMTRDLRVDKRVRKLAVAELERKAGGKLTDPLLEVRARAQAGKIYIDVDVEGGVA